MADHWGILRFVPHERLPPEQIESLWVPDLEMPRRPRGLAPARRALRAALLRHRELLGNMAVDLPPDNKIPNQQQRELLEMFVVQAGLALENAQRREQLSRQVRLGEALKKLALSSGHVDLEQRPARRRRSRSGAALAVAQVTCGASPTTVEDPTNHAAGTPRPAREQPRSRRRRARRPRLARAAAAVQRVAPLLRARRRLRRPASAPVIRQPAGAVRWTHGALAPMGVDQEVLGYVVGAAGPTQHATSRPTRSTRSTRRAASSAGWCATSALRRTERGWSRAARARPLQGRADRDHLPRAEDPADLDHRPHRAAGGGRRPADVRQAIRATRPGSTGWSPTSSTTHGSRAVASSTGCRSTSVDL